MRTAYDRATLAAIAVAFGRKHRAQIVARLPTAATIAMALVVAWQVVELTKALLRSTNETVPTFREAARADDEPDPRFSANALVSAHLFGEARSEPPVETAFEIPAADMQDSSLNLTLTGTIVAADTRASQAIIAHEGTQKSYRAGELVGAGDATLVEVFVDRVIVDRDGTLEILRPPEQSGESAQPGLPLAAADYPNLEPSPLPEPPPVQASETVRRPAPRGVANVIRLSVQTGDGGVIGLRASPGRNSHAFRDLGLQAGDVITAVNGTRLDTRGGATLSNALENNPAVTVSLLRDGIPQVLTLPASVLRN